MLWMLRTIATVGLLCFAPAAWASDQPQYEPAPAWVKPFEIPKPDASGAGGTTRVLLEDSQDKFVPDGLDSYWERAERIETPQGLSTMGNIAFDWNPDTETLLIHRVRIIRGDKVIDLLAGGQKFIVLRRENRLEEAMLDGTLTAALQPEGLRVGDILDIGIGYRSRDPLQRGREDRILTLPPSPTDVFAIREIWPAGETPHWRITEGFDQPKVTTTPEGTELTVTMNNALRPRAPRQAPSRYSHPGLFEFSEVGNWSDVSRLMAPYYDKASTLKPDSPLHDEVAKIKAASKDPKVQAAMALRLVEDQVRYLFLGMNNGGLIPVAADANWSRRFGDCKGKTALLLALLRELGIKAEPALVDTTSGDDLDVRPPMVTAFDHVMVRAEIGGKVYWMDGTRSGDRALDELPVPNYHWALPVRTAGATLEKLSPAPYERPEEVTHLRLDASAGLDVPAPAHAEYVMRGDTAVAFDEKLADMDADEADSYLRDYWRKEYDWIDITKVDAVYDEKTGEERVTMDGTARMPWKGDGGTLGRHYEADGAVLGWKPNYHRDPGPGHDAPFSSRYPYFAKMSETIVLPDDGKGFTIEGDEVDRKIGAWEFKRTAKITGNTFTMEAATRTIKPEFPADDVKTVSNDLRAMSDQTVYLRAPKATGKGTVDMVSAKAAANCQPDLPPIKAVGGKVDGALAAPGAQP
jgi:transglutaminase-like putative cysteine protease